MSDWENTDCVQQFYDNNNCPVNVMAEAYYVRDKGMGISFDDAKVQALHKLFSHNVKKRLQEEVYTKGFASQDYIDLSRFRSPRHNELLLINNHLQFYQALTGNELEYLGW